MKCILYEQQRSATKVTFPLVWTNTCCSHPLYRESELINENSLGMNQSDQQSYSLLCSVGVAIRFDVYNLPGVRNAAQRKLLDELGIPAGEVPVDQFTPLGRMLYKAPSDGKWGEHERKSVCRAITMGYLEFVAVSIFLFTQAFNYLTVDYLLFIVKDVSVNPNPDEVADIKYVNREQLKELLRKADEGEEGLKLSPWFRLVVDNFLYKWWNHVENGTLHEATDMKTIHKL